jgi:hypothetical protein
MGDVCAVEEEDFEEEICSCKASRSFRSEFDCFSA